MKVNPDTQNGCRWSGHLDVWETSLSIWPGSGWMKPMNHLYTLPTCLFHSIVQLLKHSCNGPVIVSVCRPSLLFQQAKEGESSVTGVLSTWWGNYKLTTGIPENILLPLGLSFFHVTLWCEIEIMMGNMVDLTQCVMAFSMDIVLTEDY